MPDYPFEEWIDKAEEDYQMAKLGARQRKHQVYNGVCFHAQQCAEKYLKAFLVRQRVVFPKTHDLTELQRLCAKVDSTFELLTDSMRILYPYAVNFRYPGTSATKQDAQEAIKTMNLVRKFIRARLGMKTS